ncbi:MAG TPA: 16S rRNA (uracil(1498)-N(3))-methyltransferase [Nitrospirota bacterium]|nr:16S rRNA (uracil(1498)-N(3))-methyltransferase [Nitrospirota bacterium]
MRLPRFFIAPEQIEQTRIVITGEDVRHIALVLRMKAGDELLLCDGRGAEFRVKITAVERARIVTEVTSRSRAEIREPRIALFQGLPKSDKMDLIVQKATELGVSFIVPLITERTIVKIRDEEKRVGRWQKIAREAAMQSSRLDIPRVEPVTGFKDFLRTLNSEPRTLLLLPWEEGGAPIRDVLTGNADARYVSLFIGPEGGFSSAEVSAAGVSGFHIVSLGPNILRTETAAIAALAIIGYEFGRKY